MPLSLAGEDISEEKGVDLADFGRHPMTPDGTYMCFFYYSPRRMPREPPNSASLLSSASPGTFLSTKTPLVCIYNEAFGNTCQ